ncbi:S41 family peptidase, partial [Nonomuraea sp. NPDC055795]
GSGGTATRRRRGRAGRRGRTEATMPVLSGDRDRDWDAFKKVYEQVIDSLPDDPAARQAVGESTMRGMLAGLHDNHVMWNRNVDPPGIDPTKPAFYGTGLITSPSAAIAQSGPERATPPLHVTGVSPNSSAAGKGLRPGDVIEAVNGVAPFANGMMSPGVARWLNQQYPQQEKLRLKVRRPSTGRTWTVTVRPGLFSMPVRYVSGKRLKDGIGYVKLSGFGRGVADEVFKQIKKLREGGKLTGLVLDLRGNGGGAAMEVPRLLGAFVHGKVWRYGCDQKEVCTPYKVDDSVPLLGLPLAVLTDRDCASACDATAAAVRDLKLGPIVGTRTAGLVSGPARPLLLNDNSVLGLPITHDLGPNREVIDGIGVAPDHHVPTTPKDLSTGKDPALAKALSLLTG